jgi:subtilisin family serine protease
VPLALDAHGNVIASIIGAKGNNNIGIAGVAWTCTIMHVKIIGFGGVELGDAIKGIEHAYNHGARLMNCSWNFPGPASVMEPLRLTMQNASEALFVVAAGNGDFGGWNLDDSATPDRFPQEFTLDNMILVGGCRADDTRFYRSHWGATSVDVFAPGENVTGLALNGNAAGWTDTSFAAPVVTGIAALVWKQNPSWTPQQVRQRIMSTGDAPSGLSGLCVGNGSACTRVNPAVALGTTCP